EDNIELATTFASGDPNRIVVFDVSPGARVVDLREGVGKRAWAAYHKKYPQASFDDFAEYVGADILDYPYTSHAYIVKNSAVLERPSGYRRKLMSVTQLLDHAEQVDSFAKLAELVQTTRLNRLNETEMEIVLSRAPFYGESLGRVGRVLLESEEVLTAL